MLRKLATSAIVGLVITGMSNAANAGLFSTTLSLGDYTTVDKNGAAPATSASLQGGSNWTGGSEFFVRGRANDNNPELEAQLFFLFDLSAIDTSFEFKSAKLEFTQNSKLNAVNSAELFLATVTENWNTTDMKPVFGTTTISGEASIGDNGPAKAGPAVDRDFSIDLSSQVADWLDGSQANYGLRMRIDDAFAAASFLDGSESGPRLTITQVPVPAPLALLGLGLGALSFGTRRSRQV